jgi:hypothetical protein
MYMSEPTTKRSLDSILEDFTAECARGEPKTRKPLTIWLSPTDKEMYDELQKNSGKQFCKKLQEIAVTAIRRCGAKRAQAS